MQIKDWAEVFETSESRKYRSLNWIAMPVGFHSAGYQDLIETFGDDAAGVYGAWCALCSLAATCNVRGELRTSKGVPYSIARIARETHLDRKWFDLLVPWAESPAVGWLLPGDHREITGRSPGDEQENTTATLPNQTEPNQTKPKRFIRPTLDQVIQYCTERKNRVDAQEFIDHYEANGWIRGKTPVKDWKACVRTWEHSTNEKPHKPRLPTPEENAAWRP